MSNAVKAVLAVIGGVGAVGGLLAVSIPVKDVITINQFSWTYTMDISEYKTMKGSGWSVPEGGRVTRTYTSQKDTIKTQVGTDSEGKAIYVETPVYAPYYEYDYETWVFKTNIISCGIDKAPYFKDYPLIKKEDGVDSIGDEKISNTTQRYYIHGKDKRDEGVTYEVTYDQWDKMELGGTIKVKHFRFGDHALSFDFC